MKNSAVTSVMFDVDGTLLDSKRDIAAAQIHTLRTFGITGCTPDDIFPHIGKPMIETFISILPQELHPRIPEAAKIYREYYLAHMFDSTVLFPGVRETLEELKSKNIMLAIATTKSSQTTITIFKHFKIDHYFDQIQGTDGVPAKPDPFILEKILSDLQWQKKSSIMVGDTKHDIEAAKNAGIRACGVTYGALNREKILSCHPDWAIDTIIELIPILEDK